LLLKYLLIFFGLETGGELFEHILARKYLKEPEARHFFGQLLAGNSIAFAAAS
jgi:hypothetical protein